MEAARRYCLQLLKKRLRSRFELDQGMQRRGTSVEDRQSVLTELEAVGLIDDVRFAKAFVNDRDRFQPRGRVLLAQELRQRGIDSNIISQVLVGRSEQADEVALGREVVRSKERLYAHLDPATRQRRLMALLSRRGFSYDIICRILDL